MLLPQIKRYKSVFKWTKPSFEKYYFKHMSGLRYIVIYILDKWLFKTEPGL